MPTGLGAMHRLDFALGHRQPVRGWNLHVPQSVQDFADVHAAFELGVVLAGRMRRSWHGFARTLGPGDAWLCGMWEPHSGRVVGAAAEVLVLVADPGHLADLRTPEAPDLAWTAPFAATPPERPRPDAARRGELLAAARRGAGLCALPESEPERGIRLRLLLHELLLILRRGWRSHAVQPVAGDGWTRIGTALRLALERPGGASPAEAAAACGLSRSHFDRLFRALIGQTYAGFAAGQRLHAAARLLLDRDLPIKAVARACGFTDASHLCRRFTARFGCGPRAWRRRRGA